MRAEGFDLDIRELKLPEPFRLARRKTTWLLHTPGRDTLVFDKGCLRHLLAHADILELLPELASFFRTRMEPNGTIRGEVDFGRPIGLDDCVSTDPIAADDLTWFASRPGRARPSRVSLTETGSPCSTLAYVLQPGGVPKVFFFRSAWIGTLVPPEPGFADLRAANSLALDFWCRHALVHKAGYGAPIETSWKNVLGEPSRKNDPI